MTAYRASVAPLLLALAIACTPRVPTGPRETKAPTTPQPSEAFRSRRPPPGEPSPLVYPTPTVRKHASGLTTYALHRPASTVALGISVRGGALHDPDGRSGLAVLTAHTLAEETAALSAQELVFAVEDLGTSLSVSASREGVSFGMELLPEDLPRGLELLGQVLFRPGLGSDSFQRVKERMRQAQIGERQSAQRLASLAGLRAVLGPKDGAPVWGRPSDLKALSLEDVDAFYRAHYRPNEISVVAVGDVATDALERQVEAVLAPLAQARRASHAGGEASELRARPQASSLPMPQTPSEQQSSEPRPHHEAQEIAVQTVAAQRPLYAVGGQPGQTQSAVFVGAPLPPRGRPGDAAREVMVNLLGGLFSSRLNQKLREEHGFTYGVRAFIVETERYAVLGIVTSVASAHTAAALEAIISELGALQRQRPALPEETHRARLDLNHYLLSSLEHVARVESDLVDLFLEHRPPAHFSAYQAEIARVTPAQVTAQAQLLRPKDLSAVVVGDMDILRAQLEGTPWRLESTPPSWTQ